VSALSRNNSTGPHRKPRADVYTVLLVIALIAVVAANVFLYLVAADYEFKYKGAPRAQLQQFDTDAVNQSANCNWTLV
jgi:hypothetical protein